MKFILRISNKTNERGAYRSYVLACQQADGHEVAITYDRQMLANVLDVPLSRLSDIPIGEHILGKE